MKKQFIVAVLTLILFPVSSNSAIVGDINYDGHVDLTEAVYALQVTAGLYPGVSASCILNGKGEWKNKIPYVECDVVSYNGESYACKNTHTSNSSGTFGDDATNWELLTIQGEQGPPGVSPNQTCLPPQVMVGIDESGNIKCDTPNQKIVFVTSTSYTGDLGSWPGADQKCQDHAEDAGLHGDFKAWLSDVVTSSSPSNRFTHASMPYINVDGVTIADSWSALISLPLNHKLSLTELGVDITVNVWTNTNTNGSRASGLVYGVCDHWNSQDASHTGIYGSTDYTSGEWTNSTSGSCSAAYHLYCFEQ